VACFNTHAAIDGWGRPFDLAAACAALEADVLVLEEVFAPRDGVSQAEEVGELLGYAVVELPLARAWRRVDERSTGKGWEPSRMGPRGRKALVVGGQAPRRRQMAAYEEGTWGLAVLSRLRVVSSEVVHLGKLRRDATRRAALTVRLSARGGQARDLIVTGTHMGHFSHGSLLHFLALRRALPRRHVPAVAAGDMNLWGPPVSALLGRHWRRAARGRTWPAPHPHSQLDHLLVTPEVEVLSGEVLRAGNSDHRPVRARLSWD